MSGRDAAVAVVIVCHDSAPALSETLPALLAQLRSDDELVVIDNASSDGSAEAARSLAPDAVVVSTGANLGFAGGCHAGADASSAPLLLFLNPDAVPAAGCVEALRACAAAQPEWGAWQAVVTMHGGRDVNTAGNYVHFLGFGWSGELDRSVSSVPAERRVVGFASGAALVVRRAAWDGCGGFDPRYFMYGEDLDLSLRLRLAGWEVGVEPAARVDHDYAFTKGDYKWFYLERNRWWTLVGVYPGALLAVLAPALLLFELALLVAAWKGGWLRAKLRSWVAVAREFPAMLDRRREIQATRRVSPRRFAEGLTTSLDSPHLQLAHAIPGAVRAQAAVFSALRRLLPA